MSKRKTLPKGSQGRRISPLFMEKLNQVSVNTKRFYGGEKHGYKHRLVNFLQEIVQAGGEASAIANLGYSWWLYAEVKQQDPVFKRLVDEQTSLMIRRAEELLYCRAMYGYEETVEEGGEIVKRTKKQSDRALLEFLKVHSDKYSKPVDTSSIMPAIEIVKFED